MPGNRQNQHDAELIAKVLEGRATADERARVLAEADRSPELLELLADSAAAMGDPAMPGQVVDIRSRRIPRSALIGIAAVLVAAVTLPMVWRSGGELPPAPFSSALHPSALAAARVGAPISTTRGGSAEDRASAVVAGARIADYMALGADTARGTAAAEIAAALRGIVGGGAVATRFETAEPLSAETLAAVELVVDAQLFRAAAWTETTRLAAIGGDSVTLRRPDVRAAFTTMAADSRLSSSARSLADRIVAALDTPADWRTIPDLARDLLVALKSDT